MNRFSTFRLGCAATLLCVAQAANATIESGTYNDAFDFFTDAANGWTQFANDDGIEKGRGGQTFDTEYLFYKYSEVGTTRTLSIGLQSGFDLWDGSKNNYYGGDLALSFDGDVSGSDGSGYEYAIDFGLQTRTYYDRNGNGIKDAVNLGTNYDSGSAKDQAGLYRVTDWNNDILHTDASPFAMDEGQLLQSINNWTSYYDLYNSPSSVTDNSFGKGFTDGINHSGPDLSYFRVVTFDLSHIEGLSETFTVDAHWTMSCGNDEINGSFVIAGNPPPPGVPEPATFLLLGIGSLGMLGGRWHMRRRRA